MDNYDQYAAMSPEQMASHLRQAAANHGISVEDAARAIVDLGGGTSQKNALRELVGGGLKSLMAPAYRNPTSRDVPTSTSRSGPPALSETRGGLGRLFQ